MERTVGDIAWRENDFLVWKIVCVKPFSCKLFLSSGAAFDRVALVLRNPVLTRIEQFLLAQKLFRLSGREIAAARAYINSCRVMKARDERKPRRSKITKKEKEHAC